MEAGPGGPEERGRYKILRGLPLPAALYLEKRRESPGSTRSLLFLGKKLPAKLLGNLRKPGPDFVIARYPDVAQGLPSELYDRKTAEERLS